MVATDRETVVVATDRKGPRGDMSSDADDAAGAATAAPANGSQSAAGQPAAFCATLVADLEDKWTRQPTKLSRQRWAEQLGIPASAVGIRVIYIMPQTPLCMQYSCWLQSEPRKGCVGVMVMHTDTFKKAYGQADFDETEKSLRLHGRPHLLGAVGFDTREQ